MNFSRRSLQRFSSSSSPWPDGEKHGYAIMQEVSKLSAGKFRMGPGTLYTTIQRLLDLKLIAETKDSIAEEGRRRYYKLTRAG